LENDGKIKAERTAGGHRRFAEEEILKHRTKVVNNNLTIGYCRVSTSGQRDDLDRQVDAVSTYCAAKGYQFRIIIDVGSGLNYHKRGLKELMRLIELRDIERIVVNYEDRLMRFGHEVFEELCKSHGVEIEIINHSDDKTYEQELVDDVLTIITVFSAKLYGSRSHKNQKVIENSKKMFEGG